MRLVHIKKIIIFVLRLVQLLQIVAFCLGTALVWLSGIRRAKGKTFKEFVPFTPTIVPPVPRLQVLPSPPRKVKDVGYEIEEVTEVNTKPDIAPRSRGTDKVEVVAKVEAAPKVTLDGAFRGSMKSLGYTKDEVQCIVP